MFCCHCGKKLREDARFCSYCGAPVREPAQQTASAESDSETYPDTSVTEEPAALTANTPAAADQPVDIPKTQESQTMQPVPQEDTDTPQPNPQEDTDAPQSAPQEETNVPQSVQQEDTDTPQSAPQEDTDTPQPIPQESPVSADRISADLSLRKGRVTVTGKELHLNKKHYIRKTGKKKFRKEKDPALIPLASILKVSLEHHKYGGRLFLSLLFLLCFAAGTLYSARSGYDTYNILETPYREEELAAQESVMAVIDGDGAGQLLQYRDSQAENRRAADALSGNLAELKAQQTQEILDTISQSDSFDLDAFFNREQFSLAYQEYLQDLLDAFKADEALHSWLRSYYETTKAYGGNYFLDTDLWIYNGSEETGFSPALDSAASLMSEQYDLDLYEHILFTGHIYITGADFMRLVLSLPRYTVDGAIFVKAFGGVPESSEMSVPGWTRSHYEEFWLYGIDYYGVDTPMWLDYGLSAENFNLDWNALLNESAYYDVYQNFMDKIAPSLPRCEMASYEADDTAYGGMGCRIKGTEPSLSDLIASYAESHPEFIEELMTDKAYGKPLTTSVDGEIAETQTQLEKLEKELLDLQEQEKELSQLLADADIHRNEYALLLADIEQHSQGLIRRLLFFGGAGLLCLIGGLICLCKFFSFLKRPRHLFVVSGRERDYAFNTRHFPREQIETLRSRLTASLPVPQDGSPASGEHPGKTSDLS